MSAHQAGGDVDAYCNKCKFILAHVILAMNGTKIVKVECKTCRSSHAYRAEPGKRSSSASTTRTTKSRPAKINSAGALLEYEDLMKGHDLAGAQRYRISVNYAEGDVVDHTTFGLGMVTRVMADNKMEVIFPAGRKILAHDRHVN